MRPDRAYLTVVTWPPALDPAQRSDVLASMLSVDRFRAGELAKRTTPAILARDVIDHGARVAEEMKALAIGALCVPGPYLLKYEELPLVRSLEPCDSAATYLVETWRTEPTARRHAPNAKPGPDDESSIRAVIRASSIVALVRAQVRTNPAKRDGDPAIKLLHQLQGAQSAHSPHQPPSPHAPRARLDILELLDIHCIDGAHWRIIGNRFDFAPLAPALAATPPTQPATPASPPETRHAAAATSPRNMPEDACRANLDLLADLLADQSHRTVDRGFDKARFLAEFGADFGLSTDYRSLKGFAIYSAWIAFIAFAGLPR